MHPLTPSKFTGEIRARVRPGPDDGGVLWIHGYTIDSTIWEHLWSLLPDWSHYGIDLPGHGTSPSLPPGTRLSEFGRQLAEGAIARGIRHIVGLSFGTVIALEVAMIAPRSFATVTLAAPALSGGPTDQDVGVRYKEMYRLYHQRGAGPWMTELWMRCPPATFGYASDQLRDELASVIDRHAWVELAGPELGIAPLCRQAQDPGPLSFSEARPMFILGEHELPAFRQTAGILSTIRPDARIVEIAGAGHLCILQAPEETAHLLVEHWTSHRAGIPGDLQSKTRTSDLTAATIFTAHEHDGDGRIRKRSKLG